LWNLFDVKRVRWEAPEALSPGKHTLVFDFHYEGEGLASLGSGISDIGMGGLGVLKVDGKQAVSQKMEHTAPLILQWHETFDVGADTGTSVDDTDYQVPFRFTGKLNRLTVELKSAPLSAADEKSPEEKGHRENEASQ
jgi:hypothetical protein